MRRHRATETVAGPPRAGDRLAPTVEAALLEHTAPTPGPSRRTVLLGLAVPVMLLAASGAVLLDGAAQQSRPAEPTAVAAPPPVLGQPRPVRVRIARLGVDSPLEGLDVQKDGTLAAPRSYGTAGWFEQGVVPGQAGPAVIAGHIDSTSGPAVFYRLKTLVAGDRVDVDRDDGTTVSFAVERSETVLKAKFPTGEVYGPTTGPELRLVTCGGSFDKRHGAYLDNTVVFARLIS